LPGSDTEGSFDETIYNQGTKNIVPNYYKVAKPGYLNTKIKYELWKHQWYRWCVSDIYKAFSLWKK